LTEIASILADNKFDNFTQAVPCSLECRGEAGLPFQFWLSKTQELPFPQTEVQWEESGKFSTIIWKNRDLNNAERHVN